MSILSTDSIYMAANFFHNSIKIVILYTNMQRSKYFKYGDKELEWLKLRDPVLGAAIDRIGHIHRAITPDLFTALINSIVGQQRGLRILYRHRSITTKLFNKYKQRYSPYATVASLYLWAIASESSKQ